jgi:glycine hydroxymethyltransferase
MDKAIQNLIRKEARRQNGTLDLIPSENIASRDVRAALGSVLTNKYAEGYSAMRYYGGNLYIDEIEDLCKSRACETFKLSPRRWHVNVQPYSGSTANMAVYVALMKPGETLLGMALSEGGHLTHGHAVSASGKFWRAVQYGVDKKTERLDYGAIRRLARREKPKVIVAGATAYPRKFDFKKFRRIADEVRAYLMVDMSHIAGLVAGGAHPSPFPHADVVTTTTHKTLRGPRGAIIFANRDSKIAARGNLDIARAIDRAVFPGLQGGPHANQIAAAAVALREAMQPRFKAYARQVVKNARALAVAFDRLGWRVIAGGTETHLLLIDVAARLSAEAGAKAGGIGGREASDRLEAQGIIVNKNTIPFDARKPADPSGIRLGSPVLTTRGMKENEMKIVARMIDDVLTRGGDVKKEVAALCKKFPIRI